MSDVCLLLEGTFPYVSGGVSTWVYDLIKSLPDISFSIVFLGSVEPKIKRCHYDIPHNVEGIDEYYLFTYRTRKEKKRIKKEAYSILEKFILSVKKKDTSNFRDIVKLFSLERTRGLSLNDFISSYDSWKVLEKVYSLGNKDPSFIDFFWTWRFSLVPFFSLLQYQLPFAHMYHAISTGYAGVLGALSKLQYNKPLMLTEHGIYTRERKIEISQADWIYSETVQELRVLEGQSEFFKQWWIDLFSYFSQLIYDMGDEIITLYEGNKKTQIEEGAKKDKIKIIPNGIDLNLFSYRKKDEFTHFKVGFIGRVVPIKDLKTFIKACQLVLSEFNPITFEIVGPTDEDEEYYKDCALFVQKLEVGERVKFMGKQDMRTYYEKLDLIVLTSISEAQPLVILEAGALGIPIVASNVGACEELLYGRKGEDRLIGKGGIITPVCNPKATADAILEIVKSPALYHQMSLSIRRRIETFYRKESFIANYQSLYEKYLRSVTWQA